MSAGGNSIGDIYRSVISDVINQVKEAFLDESIDLDILSQLKKEWEDKVTLSGCVDLDATAAPQRSTNVAPAPIRQNQPLRPPVQANPMRVPQQPQQFQMMPGHMQDQPIRVQYTQQPGHQIGMQQAIAPIQQIRMFPGGPAQFTLPPGQQLQPGQVVMMQQPNGQQIPMSLGPNGVLQPRIIQQSQQLSHMNQLDGNGGVEEQGSSSSLRIKKTKKTSKKVKGTGASEEDAMKVLNSVMKNMQMDGGGGMSDSSSEEEDDDPLISIADRVGDANVEDGDHVTEEDPLNSEDDQSDDEDCEQLFDADNIVMCQFEKVNRARTKWKFQLKDGIMHIEKKDYCFQKCGGEAEW